jgi:hypothetical protein
MKAEDFEEKMCLFKRRQPFFPFLVELTDNEIIPIVHPGLAINGGGATYLSPDDELVEILCERVRDIRLATRTNGVGLMTNEHFEEKVRAFLQREPFQPFVAELLDGTTLEVENPKIVLGGGGFAFFTAEYQFVEVNCENVRDLYLVTRETAS